MSFFSRLTDIVSCNLTQLLAQSSDPRAAIAEIIQEMREGLTGAQRSVATAAASEKRLSEEIATHQVQIESWTGKAKEQLRRGDESDARQCLLRKREVEDLIAGLAQQYKAAVATREHLNTIHRALDARLAEALRKQESLGGAVVETTTTIPSYLTEVVSSDSDRHREVDLELEILKQQLDS